MPYGLKLLSLYIFIVILSSITKSTVVFSAGNMFLWGYEIDVKGQNYAYMCLDIKMQMNSDFGYLTLQLLWFWLNKRVFFYSNYSKCNSQCKTNIVDNFGKVAKDIRGLWQWKLGNHFHCRDGVQEHLPLRTASEVLAKSYSLNPKAMAKIPYAKRCFWDMFGCFLLLGYGFTVKREIAGWSCGFYAMQLQ